MNVPFFEYRRFLSHHYKEINRAIQKVLSSGSLILGHQGAVFEDTFARFTGARYAVGVANGTDALILALKALGISSGDEIITVPNTAVPTVAAIVTCGAIPRFVDITSDTYLMNPALLEKAVTKKTKAILPVHLYGQSCDMKSIMSVARTYNLPVLEDCAQAHGARFRGKHVGTFGVCGCFSFYPTKNLGGYGDSGMVVTNNASFAKKIAALRNYGQNKPGVHDFHGYNSRCDEIQAALLSIHLKYLEQRNIKRRRHARQYLSMLDSGAIQCPVTAPGCTHTYHQFIVRVKNRDRLRKKLADKGIQTGIHYPTPIYKQKAYASYASKKMSCPVSESIQESIISLPIFPELTPVEIERVCTVLNQLVS